jgi:hypothetical protein
MNGVFVLSAGEMQEQDTADQAADPAAKGLPRDIVAPFPRGKIVERGRSVALSDGDTIVFQCWPPEKDTPAAPASTTPGGTIPASGAFGTGPNPRDPFRPRPGCMFTFRWAAPVFTAMAAAAATGGSGVDSAADAVA